MEQIKIPAHLQLYFEKAGTSLVYAPGETIYLQGETADRLYFIKKGRVRAFYLTRNGKELTYEIIERGRIIGESSFLGKSAYPVFVSAVNQVELLACNLEQLRRITLYDRYQKIASFLLHETAFPDKDRGVTPTGIPYTQEELAASLGLNRVTVSKVLSEWKAQGVIATAYGHIELLNRTYLEQLLKIPQRTL